MHFGQGHVGLCRHRLRGRKAIGQGGTPSVVSWASKPSARPARFLAGIELMHMIRNGQLSAEQGKEHAFAEPFDALAAQVRPGPRALENFTLIFH